MSLWDVSALRLGVNSEPDANNTIGLFSISYMHSCLYPVNYIEVRYCLYVCCRYAIAFSVLQHLSTSVDCRLLFATHYHPLTSEFLGSPRVSLGHMAAMVTGDESDGHITFLYQLRQGACPKSYGLQVHPVSIFTGGMANHMSCRMP